MSERNDQHYGDQPNGGGIPPRPDTPPTGPAPETMSFPSASSAPSAQRDPYVGTGTGAGDGPYGTADSPYGTLDPEAHPLAAGDASARSAGAAREERAGRRTVGVGALVTGMLLAGLAGGGVAAGVNAAMDDGSAAPQQAQQQVHPGTGLDINRSEDATAVTAAAAKAAPSVVTLSVTNGQGAGSGSGVILDDQGHILTNTHVVTMGGQAPDPNITVQTADGQIYAAEIVGLDPDSDLAVVKIDAQGLTPIEMGSSGELNVGDRAIAIGAPLGLTGTVTDGIVSTLDRTISVASSAVPEDSGQSGPGGPGEFEFRIPGMPQQRSQGSIYINVIQTDAAINPGNSGGALLDAQGRLIGINVAIASAGGASGEAGNIGVGFSIPVDYAQRVAQDLIEHGEATHGLLGVTVSAQPAVPEGQSQPSPDAEQGPAQQQGPEGAASGGFSAGALVHDVVPGSPAAEAGLQQGDVITGVEGRSVSDSRSLTAIVKEYPEGGTATVHYLRDGQEQSAEVTFASSAAQQQGDE